MNKADVAKLLTVASAIDSRTVTKEMVEAWWLVVGDLSVEVATKALELHWRESTAWVVPAHIRGLADRARGLIDQESSKRAQVEWLDHLSLTMDDYREHWDEPGWLEEQQRTYEALRSLDSTIKLQQLVSGERDV